LSVLRQGKYRVTFVSLLAIAIGLVSLVSCVGVGISRYQFFSASKSADAEVLSVVIEAKGGSRRPPVTIGRIRFRTEDGQVVQVSVRDVGDTDIHAVGQTIPIRYKPADLRHPETLAGLEEYLTIAMLGINALFFLVLGYVAGKKPLDVPSKAPSAQRYL
jgi:hypothetical protein